ncbi:MAG: PEP-CTERM sorting domain-containing protein [Planctomycetota bacterium]|jgi:hypothetical protein
MMKRSVGILAAGAVLFMSIPPAMAVIEFKGGLTHDIDYQINDDVWVDYQSPGAGTTLNILDGANVFFVKGWEDSIINVFGGTMDRLVARDSSHVTLSGGAMHGLEAHDRSQVAVSGGSRDFIWVLESSEAVISAGKVNRLVADVEGILTIHGSDFAVDGTPVGYTGLYSILRGDSKDESYRQLTGTLLSGEPLDSNFLIGHSAKIILVPEPATLLLLGLGGLILRKGRRA